MDESTQLKADHVAHKETNFCIDKRYKILNVLGKGSYGLVCSATDTKSTLQGNQRLDIAIKKVHNIFGREVLLKRAIREVKLMKHFRGHRNVCVGD